MAYLHVVVALEGSDSLIPVFMDLTEADLRKRFLEPYRNGADIISSNRVFPPAGIRKLHIVSTDRKSDLELSDLVKSSDKSIEELNDNSSVVFIGFGRGRDPADIVHVGSDVTDRYVKSRAPPQAGATRGSRPQPKAAPQPAESRSKERGAAFAFGVVAVGTILVLAVAIPEPKPFQYLVFRIVLAIAVAGVAAMIPGLFEIDVPVGVKAGGALGVFAAVFFLNPAAYVIHPQTDGQGGGLSAAPPAASTPTARASGTASSASAIGLAPGATSPTFPVSTDRCPGNFIVGEHRPRGHAAWTWELNGRTGIARITKPDSSVSGRFEMSCTGVEGQWSAHLFAMSHGVVYRCSGHIRAGTLRDATCLAPNAPVIDVTGTFATVAN